MTRNTLQIRVQTDVVRGGDDGQTVVAVLAGTEGTVIGTTAAPKLRPTDERVLLLTIAWDVALLSPEDGETLADCPIAEWWEEADVPESAVRYIGVLRTEEHRGERG